ncbi:hypothetical protein Acr_22g0001860 [Actinidia rufa]|uniref:Transposase (putative) gypsy type domain-containing protein n=1 Tax=Actinidia rufa TaxID=165716 RepID=A0A7J0GJ66_9ERIC|nr:hypothetical protein Acr_22g0001860 [Actinidia rufa]
MSMERYLGDIGDIIGKIAIWRDFGGDGVWRWGLIRPSILPRPKARMRQHFGSGRAHMSTLMVALASSVEMTWRGSMDSFLPQSRVFGDEQPLERSRATSSLGLRVTWFLLLTWLNDGGNHSMENTWQGGLKCGTLFEASHISTVSLGKSEPLITFIYRGLPYPSALFRLHYCAIDPAPTSYFLLGRLVNQLSAMSKRLKLSDLAKMMGLRASRSPNRPSQKKARIDTGASGASAMPPVTSGAGSSARQVLSEALGPQASVMASAATAEKILAGVVLPADKEKVDRLTFDQGVILGSSLAVRSKDFAEGALNQKAVAESAEMEMVRAQNRAIELEGALAVEKAKGRKLAEDVDARGKVISKLEARISDLEKSQSLTQGRIIAAFKESDDFLEAVRGSASSYFGDGFDFCKRQLAKQYPDLGVDLEDVEMDQELLAKEEAEAEKRAAEEEAAECCSVSDSHLAVNKSTVPFMSFNTNLGGEESEQSLPSWISDHLGAKSYIDETTQSTSSPIPTNSSKMDTSSLNKESNVMSQADLDNLGTTYSFPQGVRLWIPGDGETILSARQGEVAFYEAAFLAGLRFPIHPTIREILIHYQICPAQLSPNAWRSVICSLVIWRIFKRHLSCGEFRCLYSLSPLPDSGWYYFKARFEKNLLRGSPSNIKGWKTRFFFASGDEWELAPGTAASESLLRVPRSWGTPEPGGYFEVSKVLNSRTFKRHFAGGCSALSTSGGDNTTSGDEGEFGTGEDSVEYLGVIRRGIGGAIRRALPGIPDETLLRWLGGKVKDPFTNLLSGTFGSSSDSGSDSIPDSELPPELRSDAMSARGKAMAEKAKKAAAAAKHPTKGVVICEKRAINARGRAAEAGTSSPAGDRESESMSDDSVARRLLTGVIPASDKKEVDQLSENDLVARSFHTLGQVVVFASSLALRSQEHLHDIDFHMARADSAELELVKAQKRAVKAETRLAELNEEISRPGTEVDDLKTTVAELTSKLAKAKELAIEDFKASEEIKAAVMDSAATYFGDGFEFCKRQLLHQFPNLGADVANMAMDPSFAEEEEATREGGDHV